MVIGEDMRHNPAIEHIELDQDDAFRARPILGSGMRQPFSDRQLNAALSAAKKQNLYATVYLYPDSYKIFPELRDALSNAELPYGLELVPAERELNFGSEGSAPPEL
jgi:hypothetical protein